MKSKSYLKKIALLLSVSLLTQTISAYGADSDDISAYIRQDSAFSDAVSNDTLFEIPQNEGFAASGVQSLPSLLSDGSYGMVKGQVWKTGTTDLKSSNNERLMVYKQYVTARWGGTAILTIDGVEHKVVIATPRLKEKKVFLNVGETKTLKFQGTLSGQNVSWTTKNPNIAQVINGKIYATGRGKTIVRAVVGGVKHSCEVYVKDAPESTYLMDVSLGKYKKIKVPGAKEISWKSEGVPVNGAELTSYETSGMVVSGNDGHSILVYANNLQPNMDTGLSYTTAANKYKLTMKKGEWFIIDIPGNHALPDWRSSKPNTVSVTGYGLIYADAKGKSKITGKIGNTTITFIVTVGDSSSVLPDNIGPIERTIVDGINGHKEIKIAYMSETKEKKPESYSVSWDGATVSGQYLDVGRYVEDKQYNGRELRKRIKYTDISGNRAYADPYISGNIIVKPETEVLFEMIAGDSEKESSITVSENRVAADSSHFISAGFIPDKDTGVGFEETVTENDDGWQSDWVILPFS